MGVIPSRKNLELCDKISVSAFCRYVKLPVGVCTATVPLGTPRWRLPVLMVNLRMAQSLADAVKFVEQGRILVVATHMEPDQQYWLLN